MHEPDQLFNHRTMLASFQLLPYSQFLQRSFHLHGVYLPVNLETLIGVLILGESTRVWVISALMSYFHFTDIVAGVLGRGANMITLDLNQSID